MDIFKEYNKITNSKSYLKNRIVELEQTLEAKQAELDEARNLSKILDKLTDNYTDLTGSLSYAVGGMGGIEASLSDDIPRYVDDYYGGRVIKQEATNLTVLDSKGKATYHYTKEAANKGRDYKLEQLI